MTAVTLEFVQAKQTELASLIKQPQDEAAETLIVSLPAIDITVRAGECYAGVVLDETGKVKHHVVLMPQRPSKRLEWGGAVEWAESVGGVLPTRQEQSLLFANCKPHIEADWYWSNEEHGSEYAWYCCFDNGCQNYDHRGDGGCAVAVRRVNP